MLIPKIVHVAWKSKNILDNQSPLILNGLRNLIDMNEDWRVEISDDNEIEDYLRSNIDFHDYNLLSDKHIVEKIDVWRLIKILNEGGIYIDLDRLVNKKLNDIINPNVKCVLPINNDFDFSQDIIISCSNNPIYKEVLDLNLMRRRSGVNNIYYLGAQTYMHGITKHIFGNMIDTNPGSAIFSKIKNELSKISFIQTYTEFLPHDTFVYQHDESTYKIGNGKTKKQFYQEFNVKHWEML